MRGECGPIPGVPEDLQCHHPVRVRDLQCWPHVWPESISRLRQGAIYAGRSRPNCTAGAKTTPHGRRLPSVAAERYSDTKCHSRLLARSGENGTNGGHRQRPVNCLMHVAAPRAFAGRFLALHRACAQLRGQRTRLLAREELLGLKGASDCPGAADNLALRPMQGQLSLRRLLSRGRCTNFVSHIGEIVSGRQFGNASEPAKASNGSKLDTAWRRNLGGPAVELYPKRVLHGA